MKIRAWRAKPTVYVFVDFKKAYDYVPTLSLFQILEKKRARPENKRNP